MEPETQEKKITLSTPAAIIIAGVIIALAVVFTNNPTRTPVVTNNNPVPTTEIPKLEVRQDDHVNGDLTKAQVAIFEYSDSDCPYCARFHPVMQQIKNEYGNKVVWVYRHYPLTSLHPNAFNEAVALECAANLGGNTAFWNYLNIAIDKTFETTDKTGLENLGAQIGLDKELFARCLRTNAIAEDVRADTAEAQTIGAQGTPFSVAVNLKTGEQVAIPGAYPIEEVRKFIDSIL